MFVSKFFATVFFVAATRAAAINKNAKRSPDAGGLSTRHPPPLPDLLGNVGNLGGGLSGGLLGSSLPSGLHGRQANALLDTIAGVLADY